MVSLADPVADQDHDALAEGLLREPPTLPPAAPRRQRRWGLWLGALTGLLLVGLLLALWFRVSPDTPAPAALPPAPAPQKALERPDAGPDESTRAALAGLTAGQEQLTARQAEVAARLDAVMQAHQAQVAALQQRLEGVQTRLEGVAAAQSEWEATARRAEARAAALSDVAALKAEVQALKAAAKQPPAPAPAASAPRPTASLPASTPPPPFAVSAIERWGEEAQIAVVQGARILLLGVGDTLAGWTVRTIDPVAQTASLESAAGRVYTTHLAE